MNKFVQRWFAASIIAMFPAMALPGDSRNDTIQLELKSGALIRGQQVQQRPDRIVIDLGYRVLSVPADSIERISRHQEISSTPAEAGKLYRFDPKRREQSVAENVERCAEAVVQIKTPVGLGSGFIVHPEGYVVTNHHVIEGEHRLTVTLFEKTGQELRRILFDKVRIVALDAYADLALLKIEGLAGRTLPITPLGDSQALAQGESVFSIGSPLGFDRSISEGIVSLKNRVISGQLFIQSTTQINPGNSGGPLFNLRGQVVGVNNMKIGAVGIEGLNFAIPARRLFIFLDNADAFAFDTSNPNTGYRYYHTPAPSNEGR